MHKIPITQPVTEALTTLLSEIHTI